MRWSVELASGAAIIGWANSHRDSMGSYCSRLSRRVDVARSARKRSAVCGRGVSCVKCYRAAVALHNSTGGVEHAAAHHGTTASVEAHLRCYCEPAGSANATYAPRMHTATYSRPSTSYTAGEPSDPSGSGAVHSTLPVSLSYARILRSIVA